MYTFYSKQNTDSSVQYNIIKLLKENIKENLDDFENGNKLLDKTTEA